MGSAKIRSPMIRLQNIASATNPPRDPASNGSEISKMPSRRETAGPGISGGIIPERLAVRQDT